MRLGALIFFSKYNTISAGSFHTVGLKADSTVIAAGANYNSECNVSDWKDIVAVYAGGTYTVEL